ncbi:MAG: CaiB/BaiF CoA transferase family protein [Geminicoccaceae bacterium]
MAALFEGVRVLDLTNVLAGPFCCYQLGMLGADVIKVERPETGDLARELGADPELNARYMGVSFLAQNAGKRSITLDLKATAGKAIFMRLVASADVVVDNFRPGVMARLGLGPDELRTVKPDLITCAISGYGKDSPLAADPAYDQIIQGLAGVMSVTGEGTLSGVGAPTRVNLTGEKNTPSQANTAIESEDPTGVDGLRQVNAPRRAGLRVGYPVADTTGGMTAAFAIAAALYRRAMTGEGEDIDVSMLDSTVVSMGWAVSNWLISGVAPMPMGNENVTAAPSGSFATADGLLNIAANKQEQFETLCRLLERPELVDDPRFHERESRKANRYMLKAELERELAMRPAADWALLLNRHGVPAGEVLDVPAIVDHEHVRTRGLIKRFDKVPGAERDIAIAGAGFRLGTGDPGPKTPPPELGADNEALLGELGYDEAEISQFRAAGVI